MSYLENERMAERATSDLDSIKSIIDLSNKIIESKDAEIAKLQKKVSKLKSKASRLKNRNKYLENQFRQNEYFESMLNGTHKEDDTSPEDDAVKSDKRVPAADAISIKYV